MPGKTPPKTDTHFGQRLASLRKAAGYTQDRLAKAIGVTQRVIAYYETETNYPPAHLLPAIAKKLRVSIDELMGAKNSRDQKQKPNIRIARMMRKIETLPKRKQQEVIKAIQTFLKGAGVEC